MFLFNNYDISLNNLYLLPWSKLATPVMRRKRTLFKVLTGKENSRFVGGLLFILVLLVHLWGARWLLQPETSVTLARPLMMEASLISLSSQSASTTPPPADKPVISKPAAPVQHKKRPVKKLLKKKMRVKQKKASLPKPVTVAEEMQSTPSLTDSITGSDAKHLGTDSGAPGLSTAQRNTQPFIEARVNANYGSNPKPKYPSLALNRGWEGKVLLLVKVTAGGLSEAVTVQRSSGHQMLDESAVAAVKKWRFIPAKRGNTPVASSVKVPIVFNLNN